MSAQAKSSSLKERALRAVKWSFLGYGLGQIIRLGTNLVMTRLLLPEMFGVMSIAGMVTIILALLSDVGLKQNIVQSRRGDDAAFLDTAWVVQIIRGFMLWSIALLICVGLHVAKAHGLLAEHTVYASPILPLVLAISSFSAVISGFQSTKLALAQRTFEQKRLNMIALISQITAVFVMVPFGLVEPTIWVLVTGGLVSSLTTTVLSHTWMSGHPNRFRMERAALRELIEFGKWVMISSAVSVLAFNGDRLLLGAYVGADTLGYYAIAVLIVGAIQSANSRFANMISLPALSEIARNERGRLREIYYKLRMPADLLLLFLAGFLYAAAPLIIRLLYDPRYAPTGEMLRVLALSFVAMRFDVAQQVYAALGITSRLSVINTVRFVALYALVPPLFHVGGVRAAIWGIALHALTTVPFIFHYNARLGLNDFKREFLVLSVLPVGWLIGYGATFVLG
jgi:O-antigen/teichoic acid export membrane protein